MENDLIVEKRDRVQEEKVLFKQTLFGWVLFSIIVALPAILITYYHNPIGDSKDPADESFIGLSGMYLVVALIVIGILAIVYYRKGAIKIHQIQKPANK